jgi:VanZ family protein
MSSNNGQISHEQSTQIVSIIEDTQSKVETKVDNKTTNNDSQGNKNTAKVRQATISNLDHIVRKNAHGFMYMVLAILVSSALFTYYKKGKSAIIYILFTCLFYAVTDEFHQSFIPGRTSLVSDILVDFTGALIGLAFFYLFYYKIYTYKKSAKRN